MASTSTIELTARHNDVKMVVTRILAVELADTMLPYVAKDMDYQLYEAIGYIPRERTWLGRMDYTI